MCSESGTGTNKHGVHRWNKRARSMQSRSFEIAGEEGFPGRRNRGAMRG